MKMCAVVCEVGCDVLLVCDLENDQQVEVHTNQARCFREGEQICICYDGAMTRSIPPQISACRIWRMCSY